MAAGNVYSVGQVNAYIARMFSEDYLLRSITVRGEVSNCTYHSSGHIYFTLKDASGTLSCMMYAGKRLGGLSFPMKEGDGVVVSGQIRAYEKQGKYQLYAEQIIRDGVGLLNERFELLKKKLEEMGMFSEEYKQKIPRYIRRLGVVTAPTGAAVRDIIQIAHRRNPYVEILLYPVLVQGEGAPQSIVSGIRAMDRAGVDVMIVGRGGGSLEDLWAFNEEIVAEAVSAGKPCKRRILLHLPRKKLQLMPSFPKHGFHGICELVPDGKPASVCFQPLLHFLIQSAKKLIRRHLLCLKPHGRRAQLQISSAARHLLPVSGKCSHHALQQSCPEGSKIRHKPVVVKDRKLCGCRRSRSPKVRHIIRDYRIHFVTNRRNHRRLTLEYSFRHDLLIFKIKDFLRFYDNISVMHGK